MPRPPFRPNSRPVRASRSQSLAQAGPTFPKEWNQVFDTLIPSLVKSRFSPKDSWKDKPFSDLDCRFFTKGIVELSEHFTTERDDGVGTRRTRLGPYFSQAKYRSSYLLYFLPLQAAKFVALLQMHPDALEPFLTASPTPEAHRVLDVGAGPGTASLGLTLELLRRCGPGRFPKIQFTWVDSNREILEDGKAIFEKLFGAFPALREKIQIEAIAGDWLSGLRLPDKKYSMILLGNVLNELSGTELQSEKRFDMLADLFSHAGGAGVLVVEPAEKNSSQILGRLRDRFFEAGVFPTETTSVWGPCLHAGRCPLANAKDWCHFSVPVEIPGKWFAKFSKALGSERDWLKFSYLWLASQEHPNADPRPELRRVVSDPMRDRDGGHTILLCEPDQTFRLRLHPTQRIHRGELIERPAVAAAPRKK